MELGNQKEPSDDDVRLRREAWRHEAAPLSARIVADETATSIRRQVDIVQGYDLKASFLTAIAAVLLAGLVGARYWPTNPHAQDTLDVAVAALIVSLLASVFVWWPRVLGSDADPDVVGVHWHDYEEKLLKALTDGRRSAFKKNQAVLTQKMWGLRAGAIALGLAIIFGTAAFALQAI